MDSISAEERAIVDTVRDFVDKEVRPKVRELEHTNTYPEAFIEQMRRMGVDGLAMPYGEVAVSTPCCALVTAELTRGWMSLAGAMGGHTVVAKLLCDYGTEAQRERYLPRMATGELRAELRRLPGAGGRAARGLRGQGVRADDARAGDRPDPGGRPGTRVARAAFDDALRYAQDRERSRWTPSGRNVIVRQLVQRGGVG